MPRTANLKFLPADLNLLVPDLTPEATLLAPDLAREATFLNLDLTPEATFFLLDLSLGLPGALFFTQLLILERRPGFLAGI